MPMRRRTWSTSTPVAVISAPTMKTRAGVDGLQQVDASQQRALARPGRPDEAHDLVLRHGQVDALEHEMVAERLAQALDAQRLPAERRTCTRYRAAAHRAPAR